MIINLYRVDKRINSTKIPTSPVISMSGDMREACDIMSPSIKIDITDMGFSVFTGCNYAYIDYFKRYYHITKLVLLTDKLVEISLMCDVLATYRYEISTARNYISRCSAVWDQHIVDTLQPVNLVQDSEHSTGSMFEHGYAKRLEDGVYVVGIVSPSGRSIGSVTYYVMEDYAINDLIHILYSTDGWISEIDDVTAQLAKAIVNPMQYIVSVEWFPIYPNQSQVSSAQLSKIGQFTIPIIGCYSIIPNYSETPIKEYSLPGSSFIHPNVVQGFTDYLSSDAYSEYIFIGAPFGEVRVPSHLLYGCSYVNFYLRIDYITGIATLTCNAERNSAENNVFTITAKISTSINLSQIINSGMANTFRNATSSIDGLIGGVASIGLEAAADTANYFMPIDSQNDGALMATVRGATGILSAAQLAKNELRLTGTAGGGGLSSLFAYGDHMGFRCNYVNVPEFLDVETFGRPLCRTGQPSVLGNGYYLMPHPVVNIYGTPAEHSAIMSFMRSGFYYE